MLVIKVKINKEKINTDKADSVLIDTTPRLHHVISSSLTCSDLMRCCDSVGNLDVD